ncbi:PD-(D/E)XK nuclease superfamily protein [Streptomyces sp. ADI96-02]|uniref:PD-(D/E)XK nuclease family protein n=1 Tax=Streptomyces sp. ADI96-02 TaxID=1522760 RepID=UPI000F556138|nr:PD-(D/E)XK nuclease family protein [Streptomyces sp. ADI96-02]RPK56832.1 PD-(D/E)XK nuclease superfamily protein [Streptomyces sp. ADI96-02]
MSQPWLPPDGVRRNSQCITVSAGMFKKSGFRCPAADALKARGYRPVAEESRRRERLEHFTLGPFMAACDARNRPSASAAAPNRSRTVPLHDGLRAWADHGLAKYDAAFPADPLRPLSEAPERWTYRHRPSGPEAGGAEEYRFTVWGRCLASPDGKHRELRLPVHRIGRDAPPEGFVAATALVLAEGTPGPLPEHVRVVEFALLDGGTRELFSGSRSQALARYRAHGPGALAEILNGQEYRPGSSCVDCSYLGVCPALRSAPGLLGIETAGRPRRTWSVTNGRNYRACPARDHMRRLRLPTADAVERKATAERGRAVHAYLADRHSRGVPRPCRAEVPEQWVPDGFDLPDHERALGAILLRRHAAVCPLRCVRDGSDVRTEPRVVRHDTAADVVVLAEPDLLYRDRDSWVWRETKTSATERRPDGRLLEVYPQLALAVMLVARGDLGGSPGRARVELEMLRPGGADLEIIDPFAPAHRDTAEQVVRTMVTAWHGDDLYEPAPGRPCGRCEVARWCSASSSVEAVA